MNADIAYREVSFGTTGIFLLADALVSVTFIPAHG